MAHRRSRRRPAAPARATTLQTKQVDIDHADHDRDRRARQHGLAGPGPRALRERLALLVRAGAGPPEGGVRRRRHRVQEPGRPRCTQAMALSSRPSRAALDGRRPRYDPGRAGARVQVEPFVEGHPGRTSRRPSTRPRPPAPRSSSARSARRCRAADDVDARRRRRRSPGRRSPTARPTSRCTSPRVDGERASPDELTRTRCSPRSSRSSTPSAPRSSPPDEQRAERRAAGVGRRRSSPPCGCRRCTARSTA